MSIGMTRWSMFLEDPTNLEIEVTLEAGESIVVGNQAIHGPNTIHAVKESEGGEATGPMKVTVLS